ncbi:transcriptional regulator, GntR family [Ruegeria halocynthiae]|uniref:Transcriptional regulator, GntR family n=1 Tax=Ruegeria halocynthiae TaxID=985054 RepID=A0A1H2WHC5_9RHOB|nr:FCD domain-containing protein [Ruegeria halocynthiae]SDW79419.1 transcriptional regulator, GntR family [Ruegeria halocynthiae]
MTENLPPQEQSEEAGNSLKALPPGSNSRDVLDALSAMIDAEGLRVGDRLPPEVEIARQLGIGRAKVREALTSWQNMGIVVRNKKAGTRLAAEVSANAIHLPLTLKLEAESLLRTHSVRRPLEIEAARMAALNCTEAQGRLITARVAELIATHAAGEDWRQADYRFHSSLHDTCGNPLFGQLIRQIQQGFNEVYEAPFGQPHLGQATIPIHIHLAEAVVSGNADEAGRIVGEIMDMVEAEILQIMENQNV